MQESQTPDHTDFQADEPERKRARESVVESLRTKWKQFVSINNNRRREGLPPLMQLPRSANKPEVFVLADADPPQVDCTPGVNQAIHVTNNILQLDLETQSLVLDRFSFWNKKRNSN